MAAESNGPTQHLPAENLRVRPLVWLREGGVMSWRRVFAGRLDQVAVARSWTGQSLADTGRADDAVLIVTELVSNALLHSRSGEPGGWFGMELTWGRHTRIAVCDLGGCSTPLIVPAAVSQEELLGEHGRGLQVVRELADEIGVVGNPEGGHTVWALLALTTTPGT